MNKNRKYGLILAIVLSIFGTMGILYLRYIVYSADKNQLKLEFSGVIKQMKFDEKHIPTISIEDSTFYLGGYDGSMRDLIQIDDSIVKKKNTYGYFLYRKEISGARWQLIHTPVKGREGSLIY